MLLARESVDRTCIYPQVGVVELFCASFASLTDEVSILMSHVNLLTNHMKLNTQSYYIVIKVNKTTIYYNASILYYSLQSTKLISKGRM